MAWEEIESSYVTLRRVQSTEAKKLWEQLQEPRFFEAAGWDKAPELEKVQRYMAGKRLWIWHLIPEGEEESIGYAAIADYSGPPYVLCYTFDPAAYDIDMTTEALVMLSQKYFAETDEEELWTYLPKPLNEEAHDRLVESGFDHWDDTIPGLDYEKTAGFLMERHTYDAYYGDGDGEFDEI